tara:strand:+ start:390 stop:1166 length:777 start_codon:yes stop_codon:yes gene_type:complete
MHTTLKTRTAGSGPNLVLLHGWGVNSGVWQPIATQLEQYFSITYVDLPGFGENNQIMPKPYDLKNLAECVANVLPQNSVLAGWSLGGLVAQHVALLEPTNVKQLVLIATSPKFQKGSDWAGIDPNILQAFSQQLVKNLSKTIERFLAIQAMGSDSAKMDIKKIKSSIEASPQADIAALTAGLDILKHVDLRDQIAALKMPIHWMLGRLDSLVPAKLQGFVQQSLPNNHSVTVFPHASHAPFISHTEDFIVDLMENTLR